VRPESPRGRRRETNGFLDRVARQLGRRVRSVVNVLSSPFGNSQRAVHAEGIGPGGKLRRRGRAGRVRTEPGRATAAEGLGVLARALTNPDPRVRSRALELVCELSEDRAAPTLIGLMNDPSADVRSAAASLAPRMRARRVVSALILALDDPESSVREASLDAICAMTPHRLSREQLADADARRAKIEELLQWWRKERFEQLAREQGI